MKTVKLDFASRRLPRLQIKEIKVSRSFYYRNYITFKFWWSLVPSSFQRVRKRERACLVTSWLQDLPTKTENFWEKAKERMIERDLVEGKPERMKTFLCLDITVHTYIQKKWGLPSHCQEINVVFSCSRGCRGILFVALLLERLICLPGPLIEPCMEK